MTDREVKKELLINYFTNLVLDPTNKDLLFNTIQDAIDASVFEPDHSYEHIYPMSKFDDVMMFHKPSEIANLVSGEDMSKSYFVMGGEFRTFSYDEIDKLFPFDWLADAVLCDNLDWHDEYLQHICDLELDDVCFQIIKCIAKDDISNIFASFNYFISDTRDCDEQIFSMEEDLETVWFGILGGDGEYFMEQMTILYEAIKSGAFHITDRYWEMITVDGHEYSGIRSFNELWDSENFVRLEKDYANSIILTHDDEFLSEEVAHNLEKLFVTYGI